jgi:hypothetical protein
MPFSADVALPASQENQFAENKRPKKMGGENPPSWS